MMAYLDDEVELLLLSHNRQVALQFKHASNILPFEHRLIRHRLCGEQRLHLLCLPGVLDAFWAAG